MFFDTVYQVNDIKSLYRDLAFQYHPDRNPAADFEKFNRLMQQVNAEYHEALKSADRQTAKGEDGKDHTYYYNQEREQAVVDKIAELIKLQMDGVDIWLVGTWVWVEGNTRPYKDQLGKDGLGLSWHSKRKMWYFRTAQYRTQYSGADFDTLKTMYGAEKYENERDQRPALA